MKAFYTIMLLWLIVACSLDQAGETSDNPFLVPLNEPVQYHLITSDHIQDYAQLTITKAVQAANDIRNQKTINFESVLVALDNMANDVGKARSNCHMLYWVSPDSLAREVGRTAFQKLDSLNTVLYADKQIYQKIVEVKESDEYQELAKHQQNLLDQTLATFGQSGVGLEPEALADFQRLTKEVKELTSQYSINMNTDNSTLRLNENGAQGLPENLRNQHRQEDGHYEIPVMPSTAGPVLSNASLEQTRKDYVFLYRNRAADKNLEILDQLVQKRYEIAQLIGKESFAVHQLTTRMAANPARVWEFINGLNEMGEEKSQARPGAH